MKNYTVCDGYRSTGQNKRHQTRPNYNKHVEAVENCREYLAEARSASGIIYNK